MVRQRMQPPPSTAARYAAMLGRAMLYSLVVVVFGIVCWAGDCDGVGH